jgi:predicted DNA-binding transcriptional regulator YafY
MNSNSRIITEAIQSRKVLKFNYADAGESMPQMRIVEPFTLGVHKDTGNLVLSAWQTGGHTKSGRLDTWKLYIVDNMQNIIVTDEPAASYHNGYNPRDSRMVSILCTT